MITLTIQGNTPSKKNSKRVFCRGKYPTVLPSKQHELWHQTRLYELKMAPVTRETVKEVSECTMTFYVDSKRKYDLSNKAESIMDLLVDAGILEDDNYQVVPRLTLIHGGFDKENPRVEIEIL